MTRSAARGEKADCLITMYVAPGVLSSPTEDVVRAEGESDEDYADRQALIVKLWSIPDNARCE